MARTKKLDDISNIDPSSFEPAEMNMAEKLGEAFQAVITQDFGFARAPKPYVTPFGIKHLDAILGGGIISSAPVVLSSTPETGKSTFAFQFSKVFQTVYPNSIIVYLDIEGAANATGDNQNCSRMEIFGIDSKRFRYEPAVVDIFNFFEMITTLIKTKKLFEEKLQKEFKIMFIWDSIAATPCSKMSDAEDPNRIIGLKARQLSFCIDKYAPLLAYNRITFLTIDQVRANLKLEGQYVAREKSVGTWNDYKAASSVVAFNHKVGQWLFLSRKASINPSDGMGITGWFMNIFTEKNKHAPSQESVICVFDKRTGLHKFWSEYTFISEMTLSERKYFKDEKHLVYPLSIRKSGPQVSLEFIDPTTGKVQYTSDKFYRKNAYDKYLTDENFRKAFDYVVDVSVNQRINIGLFRMRQDGLIVTSDEETDTSNIDIEEPNPAIDGNSDMDESSSECLNNELVEGADPVDFGNSNDNLDESLVVEKSESDDDVYKSAFDE
ncbi:MAG: ATPase domain-containing protein [Sphaerochaetaceae bacterium]|nr:ATPase domain-containing protein [Sphaerochaetaceae bacterium]